MANPQPTDSHLRISHKIIKEILRRNFTKQQKNILDLILRLSWGCGKPSAYIPLKKHFRLCGVSEKQIGQQLHQLVQMKVLLMDEKACFYQIQKDYDQWQVTPVMGWNEEDYNDLVSLNIKTTTPDLRDKLPESGTNSPKVGSDSPNRGQTPRNFPGSDSPNRGVLGRKKLCGIRLRGFSIKKDLYNKKNILQLQPLQTHARKKLNPFLIFENEFGRPLGPMERDEINWWLDKSKHSPELIVRALKEAVLAQKLNFKYIDACLTDWRSKGWHTPEQVDFGKRGNGQAPSQPKNSKVVPLETPYSKNFQQKFQQGLEKIRRS